MNARKYNIFMLLTPWNCTNPAFWGKDLVYKVNNRLVDTYQIKSEFPTEFDFFNFWCGKDPINAKNYYGMESSA